MFKTVVYFYTKRNVFHQEPYAQKLGV